MEEMEELSPQQLPSLVKEWINIRDELEALSAATREKRKRAQMLRSLISKIMQGNKVGQLNISAGTVRQQVKTTKVALTKKYMIGALTDFFSGDAARAQECFEFLDSNRPTKQIQNLVLDAKN